MSQSKIYIIDDTDILRTSLKEIFKGDYDYKFINVDTNNIDVVLKNIPSLIIIDEDNINVDIFTLCESIRNNEDNKITPIIIISSNADENHRIEIMKKNVEYYIVKPVTNDFLYYTIKNLLRLLYTNRTVSPLTGLPGNVQIQAELKKRLLTKKKFSVLYLDLDNFKSYNDLYGFLHGDEIIKFTADIISKNIHLVEEAENFVGHIGGDDFVAIVEGDDSDEICKQIIAEFDVGIEKFYNNSDWERGYLEVENRKSIVEQFPLTSISIGVVIVNPSEYSNILQIGEVGAQVKHIAKTIAGSTYVVNRRRIG